MLCVCPLSVLAKAQQQQQQHIILNVLRNPHSKIKTVKALLAVICFTKSADTKVTHKDTTMSQSFEFGNNTVTGLLASVQ